MQKKRESCINRKIYAGINNLDKFCHSSMCPHFFYNNVTGGAGKASACVGCGQCEGVCPQHLPIIDLMKEVAEVFDK